MTCGWLAAAGMQCFAVTQPPLPKPPWQLPLVEPLRPLQPCLGLAEVRLVMLPALNQLSLRQSTGSPQAPTLLQVWPPFSDS